MPGWRPSDWRERGKNYRRGTGSRPKREEDKKTRKEREANAKGEAEMAKGIRAWAEAEARVKAEIARIAAKASESSRQDQRRILPGSPSRQVRGPISRPR